MISAQVVDLPKKLVQCDLEISAVGVFATFTKPIHDDDDTDDDVVIPDASILSTSPTSVTESASVGNLMALVDKF